MPDAVMTLRYDGEAVDAGTMDVRQLAPALIAAADAVREAHALLGVAGPTPQVEVRAVRPGSFIVDLVVAEPTAFQRMLDVLTTRPVGALEGLEALVMAVVSAVKLIKRVRNRKISRVEETEDDRTVTRLILEDGTIIEIPAPSFTLTRSADFRRSVRGMVEPLEANVGITQLVLRTGDEHVTVTNSDIPAFDMPPALEVDLGESECTVVLRPVNVSFAEGNKWRFNDGDTTFFASIEDSRFISDINHGERFAKNDMLRVRMRTSQAQDASGLRTDRTIIEVIEHIAGGVQLDLFSSNGD
jgi:hypothetical protein